MNLLRVAGEPSVDISVRQVASISFKQVAKKYWEPEKGTQNQLGCGQFNGQHSLAAQPSML